MEPQDLLDKKAAKEYVPKWVTALCATLMFLSVFINSIGLNLMQINGALTTRLVNAIEGTGEGPKTVGGSSKSLAERQFMEINARLKDLEKDSHSPTKPKE